MRIRSPPSEYLWAVSGGLLSSSCCVLQLVLNAFQVGCAGFAVLTPYRPAFLTITTLSLAYTHHRYKDRRRTVFAVVLALGLSISPELVQLYNKHSHCWPQVLCGPEQQSVLHFQVEGLKCASCAARLKQKVSQYLSKQKGSCQVDFETGNLVVTSKSLDSETLMAAVRELGFGVKLLKQQKQTAQLGQQQLTD